MLRHNLPGGLVTFLFTDIEGSTRLARLLGPAYRQVLIEHRRVVLRALSDHGGIPLFTEGDSIFVVFSDAASGIAACVSAQLALADYTWPSPQARPSVRMGLHSGFAQPVGGEYTSPEVHRAARVAAAAHGGQIMCSEATVLAAGSLNGDAWLLDLGLHRLRGFDDRERLYQVVADRLERKFPHPRTLAASPHNLPSVVTSFIGRGAERSALVDLLDTHRLVNVVGPGGAGKTRLALEVAGDLVAGYPDGVWFTDLASVTDPGLVDVAVAAALGLRPEPGRAVVETLREFTADRACLLVLDTCDAQPGATAAMVSRILASGSSTRVLATSREPLNVAGEIVWRIPPLSLAYGPGGEPSEAVTLLLARISANRGGEPLAPSEVEPLARVARRLDGLPLALELAAARLRTLSAGELAGRLDTAADAIDIGRAESVGRIDEDAASRHATMQAAVSWSYRTLMPDAARLLRLMSTFASGVDLAAIAWLAGGDPVAALSVLVDKSLVVVSPNADGTRYRMLDPIRAYASRRLSGEGEDEAAHAGHVAWARREILRLHRQSDGRTTPLSMYAIDPLADEIRTALRWSVTRGSARDAIALAAGLDQWWRERGLAREGRLWLFRAYERIAATAEVVPEAELAAAYYMHARHAGADGEHAEALRFAERAAAVAKRTGNNGLLARVSAGRAVPVLEMGDVAGAERVCREVIAWAGERGVAEETLEAVYLLAQLLWRRGALDEAAELLANARSVEGSLTEERGRRMIDMILGMVALSRGDLVAAHDHLIVALRSRMTYGFHSGACEAINALAARCALGGDQITAARLYGAASAAQVRLRGTNVLWSPYWIEQQARIRTTLGDRVFDDVYGQGTALTLDEAVAVALSVDHPDLAAGSGRFADISRAS